LRVSLGERPVLGLAKSTETGCSERILPGVFLNPLPVTGTAYVTVGFFLAISIVVYASSGFSLVTVSTMFSATFLFTMLLVSRLHQA
jgi:hypothetical protein